MRDFQQLSKGYKNFRYDFWVVGEDFLLFVGAGVTNRCTLVGELVIMCVSASPRVSWCGGKSVCVCAYISPEMEEQSEVHDKSIAHCQDKIFLIFIKKNSTLSNVYFFIESGVNLGQIPPKCALSSKILHFICWNQSIGLFFDHTIQVPVYFPVLSTFQDMHWKNLVRKIS